MNCFDLYSISFDRSGHGAYSSIIFGYRKSQVHQMSQQYLKFELRHRPPRQALVFKQDISFCSTKGA